MNIFLERLKLNHENYLIYLVHLSSAYKFALHILGITNEKLNQLFKNFEFDSI